MCHYQEWHFIKKSVKYWKYKAENVQYEMAVRTADGDFDPSDDPLSYVAAQYHPDLYNNFTGHTFNSGSSYGAVLDD